MIIQGVFLWLAGPYLASWITPNLMEQASIWCFFSIAQIGIMLFLIREQLIVHWGRTTPHSLSIHSKHEKDTAASSTPSNGSSKKDNGKHKKL